jgi:hypothetical protein
VAKVLKHKVLCQQPENLNGLYVLDIIPVIKGQQESGFKLPKSTGIDASTPIYSLKSGEGPNTALFSLEPIKCIINKLVPKIAYYRQSTL